MGLTYLPEECHKLIASRVKDVVGTHLRARHVLATLLVALTACGDDGAGASPSERDASASGMGGKQSDSGKPTPSDSGGGGAAAADSGMTSGSGAMADAAPAPGRDGGDTVPGDCPTLPSGTLPEELYCTGLYADFESKTPARGVREFAPAHQLWSDGADKTRWVFLPQGSTIDASDPNDWRFPVGTKLWKEFRWKDKRAETRIFWKTGETRWAKAAYQWNEDDSAATRFAGGMVEVAGEDYYIPSPKECDLCHKGRTDRALGFEAGLLGLEGATGVTLAQLIDDGLLEGNEITGALSIGDDNTGKGAAAMAWLHVNCGVSCHNANPAAEGYKTDLKLRLSAAELDGSALLLADARITTIDVEATTLRWSGRKIIVRGSPEDSLLYSLITHRDPANMKDQMPPIATRVVDDEGVAAVQAWIEALGTSTP